MTIRLHPKIEKLVRDEVRNQNKLPKTKRQRALNLSPLTPRELVNELLWCALRNGDITHHYTAKCHKRSS